MSREILSIFDTTLRDGAQMTGIDFSLGDKRNIAALLDDLGWTYIEGGYPGANPLDTQFFEQRPNLRAKFAAFGMTKRAGRSADNDPGLAATLAAEAMRSSSSPKPGTTTSTWRSAPPWRRTSTASRPRSSRRAIADARRWSIASTSSMAFGPIPAMR